MLPIHSITASSPSRFCEWICVYQVYHIVTTSATYYNLEQWSFRFVSLTGASCKKSYVRPATKVLGKADVPLDRKTSRRIHVPQPKVDDKQFFTRVRTGVCYAPLIPLNWGRRIVRTVQGGMLLLSGSLMAPLTKQEIRLVKQPHTDSPAPVPHAELSWTPNPPDGLLSARNPTRTPRRCFNRDPCYLLPRFEAGFTRSQILKS